MVQISYCYQNFPHCIELTDIQHVASCAKEGLHGTKGSIQGIGGREKKDVSKHSGAERVLKTPSDERAIFASTLGQMILARNVEPKNRNAERTTFASTQVKDQTQMSLLVVMIPLPSSQDVLQL